MVSDKMGTMGLQAQTGVVSEFVGGRKLAVSWVTQTGVNSENNMNGYADRQGNIHGIVVELSLEDSDVVVVGPSAIIRYWGQDHNWETSNKVQ